MNNYLQKLLFLFCFTLIQGQSFGQVVYDSLNIALRSNWDDPAVPGEPFYGIRYNGIWGWHDGNGHEYALIGATNGVYFIDVTNPSSPVQADFVAGRRDSCIWREIKTYDHYAYLISDDASPNSFQIVDLQYLPDSVSVVYDGTNLFERAHTLFVDGDHLYCGIVKGGQFPNTAAMAVFSLANPVQPTLLRKLNTDFPSLLSNNQVHDMFSRNDTVYASCAYDGLFIFKYNAGPNNFSLAGSVTSYPQQGYNHSSALTDDGSTLVFMDEVPNGLAVKVLDVTDFSNLTIKSTFQSNPGPTPHNPFMVGNTCYIAYYQDGLQVYDVSDPVNPVRIGYFDTHHQTAMGGPYPSPAYQGAWGAYPYLPSGNVLVSDMQNGLFVLDPSGMFTAVPTPDAPLTFSVFPNPVSGNQSLTIRLADEAPEGSRVVLSDMQGR
ncbi:MAG: choice-of-anchor B family protein, partial [Bacteroidia bacterium]|nr:choice-of-anchor B family protein [Bacteroidia bacterium]